MVGHVALRWGLMDVETQRQIAELENLRTAHRDRLQVLKIQEARMGRSTPPEVTIEIADIGQKLTPIDAAIFKLTYVGNVRADVPNDNHDRGDNVSMAVERTLERHRRAMVASQTDQLLYLNVRVDSAVRDIRLALIAIATLASSSLLLSAAWWIVYMVTR